MKIHLNIQFVNLLSAILYVHLVHGRHDIYQRCKFVFFDLQSSLNFAQLTLKMCYLSSLKLSSKIVFIIDSHRLLKRFFHTSAITFWHLLHMIFAPLTEFFKHLETTAQCINKRAFSPLICIRHLWLDYYHNADELYAL